MSSTTGSRHNCEQGQGYSPPQQRNHRGERQHHRPHPTGGAGGIPWGGGGEGGCGSPASYMQTYIRTYIDRYIYYMYIYIYTCIFMFMFILQREGGSERERERERQTERDRHIRRV